MTGAETIKCQWVRDISSEHGVHFCALQEHFKTVKSTEQWFRKQFSNYHTHVIPAYRLPGVDSGRGIGGLVQLSGKSPAVKRARVVSQSPRVQAQILNFPSCKILWINSYMPCDPQLQQFDDTELIQTLSEVERIVNNSNDCEVVWSGDMNYDYRRDNHFTRTVLARLQKLHLTSTWEGRNVDYTHIHTDNVKTSMIDHFFVSPRLLNLIEDCGPVHRGDNLSRHSPIFLSLRLGELQKTPAAASAPPPRMPAWDRATQDELNTYTSQLHQRLQEVQCPNSMVQCKDPLCTDASHSERRDSAVLDILFRIVETSYVCLPLTGCAGRSHKQDHEVIPGWTVEVEPHRQKGDLHQAKLESHCLYRYAVRRVKRANSLHQAKGLFAAAQEGDLALMKEMRRLQSARGPADELTDTVDGITGQQGVANQFGAVYSALYNSAGSTENMKEIQDQIRRLLPEENCQSETEKITADIVKKAAGRMKTHKMDISQGFTSDCFLHAPDIFFNLILLVFQDWLTHGTVTRSILSCAFIPLLKNSMKDPAKTESYRAIAGSSLLLKLFEQCILIVWGDKLHSDTLQFGFKRGCGTSSATWLVQEVLQHYLRGGSKPIVVVLDCSKAFDMAKFDILFERLLTDRKMPGVSGKPGFLVVYLDPLFSLLRSDGVGCHVAGVFMGAVGYADDLILMAPSRGAAQKMLSRCESFATDHNIQFSTDPDPTKSKTKAIYVTGPRGGGLAKPVPLQLCGRSLPWVARAEHLGHALSEDGTMRRDAVEKRAQFINCSVKIRESFSFAHPDEQLQAAEKYCTSVYGSNLYDFNSKEFNMICSAWKTSVKLAWGVHRGCRTYILQQVLAPGVTSLRVNLLMRFRTFFRSLLVSPSQEVQVAMRLAARDIRTPVGSNLALLRQESGGLDPWTCSSGQLRAALLKSESVPVPDRDRWRLPYLRHLLKERQDHYYAGNVLNEKHVASLIDSLVVN